MWHWHYPVIALIFKGKIVMIFYDFMVFGDFFMAKIPGGFILTPLNLLLPLGMYLAAKAIA